MHGKIIPVPANKNKQAEERAQVIRDYCDVTCINPFRPKEGQNYLQSITHNRRRWSHVFPTGLLQIYLHSPHMLKSPLFIRRVRAVPGPPGLRAELEEPDAARDPATEHGLPAKRGRAEQGLRRAELLPAAGG